MLLLLEAIILTIPAIVSFCYGDKDVPAFFLSSLATALTGGGLMCAGRQSGQAFSHRDGLLLGTSIWILYTLFGTLPLLLSGVTDNFTDAFMEMMSGFTTTGCSALNNIDTLSHGVLLWRSISHFIGGLGIIVLTIAVLPNMGVNETMLSESEQIGPLQEKVHPRVKTTAGWLLGVYMCFNVLCILSLYLCGMNLFDAVCYAFSICATGGLVPHSAGLVYFHSPAMEYVACFFMLACSMNFVLFYLMIFKRRFSVILHDVETRWYVGVVVAGSLIVFITLWNASHGNTEHTFRQAFFQTISSLTTSGISNTSTLNWPPLAYTTLVTVMFIGGCSHSTAGGIKTIRLLMLWKVTMNELNYRLHPRAIFPVKVGKTIIHSTEKMKLLSFVSVYVMVIFAGMVLLQAMGLSLSNSASLSVAAISNGGAAFGHPYSNTDSWSFLSTGGKWVISALMFLGRLEIFTVLMCCSRKFWLRR